MISVNAERKETGTEKERQTDRQTNRQGDLHKEHVARVISTPVDGE